MQERQIAPNLVVTRLGYGCMGLSYGYHDSGLSEDEKIVIIHAAYAQGIRFFDTAQVYGDNELLVGKAIAGFRDEIVLASKGGVAIRDGVLSTDASPATLTRSLDESLKRLKTDWLDIYYLHRLDPETPIETVAQTMAEFIAAGKIRHWGLSEVGAETVRRAHTVCPVSVVQSEYSMMWREPEQALFPTLEALGIGFVPFSPLGKGFLTGRFDASSTFEKGDFRTTVPRFQAEHLARNQVLIDLIDRFAQARNCTKSQIALAWVCAQRPWIAPIFGTTNPERLRENIGSADIVLTPNEVSQLNEALDGITVSGDRYSGSFASKVGK